MGYRIRSTDYSGAMIASSRSDLAGRRFGKLIVNTIAERRNEKVYWLCTCDCGNRRIVPARSLTQGKITSCEMCK